MKTRVCLIIVMLGFLGLAGCPDYSHLREVPDYDSHIGAETDPNSENSETAQLGRVESNLEEDEK